MSLILSTSKSELVNPGKGLFCSEISQDPTVQAGVGLSDARDPRGPWCYVEPGLCGDEERSQVFPELMLSYKVRHLRSFESASELRSYEVCSYAMVVGTGAVVPGFPNGGLAFTYDEGYGFGWGDGAVIAAGRTYDLCWCNGTASDCTLEADFKARTVNGAYHLSGASWPPSLWGPQRRAGAGCGILPRWHALCHSGLPGSGHRDAWQGKMIFQRPFKSGKLPCEERLAPGSLACRSKGLSLAAIVGSGCAGPIGLPQLGGVGDL